MKETYPKALAFVLAAEGPYSDDPGDSGGPTSWGLTAVDVATHRGISASKFATHAEKVALVKSLTTAEVHAIYAGRYWTPVGGDELPYPLDMIMFDTGVNMGVSTAIVMLRVAMGLPVAPPTIADTMKTVNNLGSRDALVVKKLLNARVLRYQHIADKHSEDERFLRGWLNRVDDLKAAISKK